MMNIGMILKKKKMEDYDKKEYEKKIENKIKNEENLKIIKNQFFDLKRKKIEDLQDNYVEGEIIKLNTQNELKEELKIINKLKEKNKKCKMILKKQMKN